MITGKGAAYRRLSTPNNDLSTTIINQENQDLKIRAEKRLISDRERANKDRERVESDKYGKELSKLNIGKTGYKSHDEPLMKLLQGDGGIFDQYNDIHEKLRKNPNDWRLLAKKTNIEKSIGQIKAMRDKLIQRGELIKKGLENGAISRELNKDYIENYKNLIGKFKYDYKIDDEGNVSILNLGKEGFDDGLPDEITFNDIFDDTKLGVMKKGFNMIAEKNTLDTMFGSKDETTEEGDKIIRKKGFNMGSYDELNTYFDSQIGSYDNITDKGKSYIADYLGIPLSQVDKTKFNTIKTNFVNGYMATYDETKSEKTNQAKINARNSNARSWARLNKETLDKKQPAYDGLKTMADNILLGNPKYLQAVVDMQPKNSKQGYVSDIEFVDGKILYTFTKGKTNNVREIDPKDPNAIGQVLKLIDPTEKSHKLLYSYNKGKNTEEKFTSPTNKISRIRESEKKGKLLNSFSNAGFIPVKKTIEMLEKAGYSGFKEKTNYLGMGNSQIITPDGKKFYTDESKGMKGFVKWFENYKSEKKEESKEPKELSNDFWGKK